MEPIVLTEQSSMQQSGFDYSQLDEQTAKFAWQRAQEIRWLSDSVAQQMVDIGRKLIEVKDCLPHGCFSLWLKEEFAWSNVQAGYLMRVAKAFGSIDLSSVKTTGSALKLLSSASLPEDILDEARRLLLSGGIVTTKDARDLIQRADPELAERFANTQYWVKRRESEAQQIISHAAEFQAAVRNLQIVLSEIYDPVHPRVKRATDQLTNLVAVIMASEEGYGKPKLRRRKSANATSKYWGVSWNKAAKKWSATLWSIGEKPSRSTFLGFFATEAAAAAAYDAKARELYGDKARLNFPDEA
jgi:hypothetical protein